MLSDRPVSEYDAFGRKKGEDPLAELRGVPAPTASPPRPTQPPRPPRPPRRRVPVGPLVVSVLAVIVVAFAGLAAMLVVGSDVQGGLSGSVQETAVEPQQEPAEERPARGLQRGSLLRRDALARAVKAMRVAELGSPVTVRVASDRVDAQLKTRDGRLRSVQVRQGGAPREISLTPGAFDHVQSMRWTAVRPAAVERLVRAAAKRMERSAATIDYLVLMSLPQPTWGVFFKDGTHFQANAAGKITRRVS